MRSYSLVFTCVFTCVRTPASTFRRQSTVQPQSAPSCSFRQQVRSAQSVESPRVAPYLDDVHCSHHTNQGTAELPGTELAAGSTCPCTGSCRKDSRNWMKNIQSANQAVYSKANVRSTKCDNYCAKTGCGWTNQYKCPWDTRKNIPFAGDDGGLGFECCCKVQKIQGMCGYFDASNAEIAALEANLKVPYAPAAAQTGAKAILGPIIGMFSMMAAGPMGLASPIPVGGLISGKYAHCSTILYSVG